MGAQGTATLDFGASPGKAHAEIDVTGQGSIIAGSLVEAWVRATDTADHTADEHLVAPLRIVAGDIVAGVGFTIHGFYEPHTHRVPDDQLGLHGSASVRDRMGGGKVGDDREDRIQDAALNNARGQWNVGWVWN